MLRELIWHLLTASVGIIFAIIPCRTIWYDPLVPIKHWKAIIGVAVAVFLCCSQILFWGQNYDY